MGNGNYVQYRNTFFFDKKSYQQYGTNDYSKAYVYQWLKTGAGPSATGALDSQKAAMEGRIYYNTPGATSPYLGTNEMPSAVGRVLDGGSNQISYFSYNDLGKVTMSVDPANRTNIFVYATNQIDLLKAIVGNSTNNPVLAEFAYNSQHLPTRAINLSRQTNFFGYNAYGQLTAMTNAKNEKISLAYDSKGYLTNVTGSIPGMTSSFIYDGYGRVQSVTDAEGYVVSTEYDAMDRPTKITHPDGTYEQIVYKWLDPILFRDRRGHWTQKVYDPLRRVKEIQDSLGRITRFDWCNCGSLDSMTDPMGRVTSWTRDLQGRVTAKVYPNTTTNYFIYETNSSRLWMTVDAKNQTNIYSYYIDNNLKSVVYTNAAVATPTVSYTYDTTNLNRLLTMVDGTGTNTYTYHSLTGAGNFGLGQLASVNGPLTNDTVSFDYDRLGRVTNRTINAAGTRLFYDAAGRVMRLTNVLGSFTNSYVTNTTRLSSIRASTGKKTTFNYYGATNDFRLQQILHSNSTVQLSSFSYTYDADGQIATWTQQTNTATPKVLQLEYDPVDQLIGATVRSNSVAGAILKRYAYGYDAAGNRTAEQIDLKPDSAGYNTANQLTNTTGTGTVRFKGSLNKPGTVTVGTNTALMSQTTNFTGLADVTLGTNVITVKATDYYAHIRTNQFQLIVTNQAVAKTLDYDANGNLTNAVTATTTNSYLWDAADRLVRITKLTNAITYVSEFTYDGLGRRTQIIERTNGVAVSTNKFLWVGMELCEQRNNTGATVTKRFFDQGEQISGTNYYFTTDHLGSIREMTTAAGVIAARYDYDPYGRRTKISGSIDADFAFTGHYYHAPSGLHLAPYRAYDAETGRWISRDPIEEEGGVNLYAYVGNDPVNMVDPLGLAPWKKAIQVYEAAKKEYKLVANVKEKSGTKATDAIKGALDSIDTSKGTKRVVETSDDAASKWLAGELGNGKLRKKESSPGYPEGYHPTGGNYGDVHIQTRRAGKGAGIKYLSILAGILIPQALRASNDPCNSAFDVGVAGAWDIASTLDPIFLTDALEWIFKVRPEDY